MDQQPTLVACAPSLIHVSLACAAHTQARAHDYVGLWSTTAADARSVGSHLRPASAWHHTPSRVGLACPARQPQGQQGRRVLPATDVRLQDPHVHIGGACDFGRAHPASYQARQDADQEGSWCSSHQEEEEVDLDLAISRYQERALEMMAMMTIRV